MKKNIAILLGSTFECRANSASNVLGTDRARVVIAIQPGPPNFLVQDGFDKGYLLRRRPSERSHDLPGKRVNFQKG